MALAATLAAVGLGVQLVGNIFSAIGNNRASKAAEADLRADAAEQQQILGKQTALGIERLTEARNNTLFDINRSQTQAQSGLQAGGAARGLSGSSGTVDALADDIDMMARVAKGRANTEFSLGMKSVDLQAAQGQYTIDNMTDAADAERANRGWSLAGDLFGMGTDALSGIQAGAEKGFWG